MNLEKMFFGALLAVSVPTLLVALTSRSAATGPQAPETRAEWAQVYWLKRAALAAEQRCAEQPLGRIDETERTQKEAKQPSEAERDAAQEADWWEFQ